MNVVLELIVIGEQVADGDSDEEDNLPFAM